MKILIDASQIPLNKTGVGIYAVNLVRSIADLNSSHRYIVIIQSDETAFDDLNGSRMRLIRFPSRVFRILFFRFFLEQVLIPVLALRNRIDVIHSLHYSFPLLSFSKKRIVTVHDMTFFKFPQAHIRFKQFYFRFFILTAARLAHHIICDSQSSRADLMDRTNADGAKITTVYLGGPDKTATSGSAELPAGLALRFGITARDYLLFVGTLEPRKNLERLICAFDRFIQPGGDYQLVILGGKGWHYDRIFELVQTRGLTSQVIFTGYVDQSTKLQLMRAATLFIYPSLYEGFGLPVLEALSLGVPTITSNVSSLPEVAGDAAVLVDPCDVIAICDAIKMVLSSKKLQRELAAKALLQADKFDWHKTAADTIDVYESAAANP